MKDADYYQIIESSDVAPLTKVTNVLNLKKLVKCGGESLDYVINNPDEMYPKIAKCFHESNTSDASLFTSIGSLMSLIKWSKIKEQQPELYDKWSKDYFKPLSKRVTDQRESNQPTQRQKNAMVTWSHVIDIYNQYKRREAYTVNHVFLAMCVLLPVRRQADYSKIEIVLDENQQELDKSSDNTGWIDMYLEKPMINVVVYKTSKDYKKWTKELPDKLIKIIRKSLDKYPRKYLLVDPKGESWNSVNSFTQYYNRFLKKIFDNKAMSLNALRHSYAGHLQTLDLSVKDRKEIAMGMGHSYETNMTYVLKNDDKKKNRRKVKINGKRYYLIPVE